MQKRITTPVLKKGKKKFKLYYIGCWIGLHEYELEESIPCALQQKARDVGSCNLTLYKCWRCGKEKLVASEIIIEKK